MEKEVVISVNGSESRIVFIDHQHGDIKVRGRREGRRVQGFLFQLENLLLTYTPHAILVVMAVDQSDSFHLAEHILLYLSHNGYMEHKVAVVEVAMILQFIFQFLRLSFWWPIRQIW